MSSELPLGFPHLLCAPQHCLYFSSDHTSAVCTLSFFQHFDTGSSISRYMRWKISFGVSHKGFFLKRLFLAFFFFPLLTGKTKVRKDKKGKFLIYHLKQNQPGNPWHLILLQNRFPPPSPFFSDLSQKCLSSSF